MKKLFCLMLVVIMSMALCACGKDCSCPEDFDEEYGEYDGNGWCEVRDDSISIDIFTGGDEAIDLVKSICYDFDVSSSEVLYTKDLASHTTESECGCVEVLSVFKTSSDTAISVKFEFD